MFKNQITKWENPTSGISLHKEDLMQTENESHQQKIARVIALINPSASSINTTIYTSSMILDPMITAREACSADIENTIFRRLFGVH